jgi:hypothetical protein
MGVTDMSYQLAAAYGAQLGGMGFSLWGVDQRKRALAGALAGYQAALNQINQGENTADQMARRSYNMIANQYDKDVAQYVNTYDPNARAGAFQAGTEQGMSGIQQALSAQNQQNPIGQNTQYSNPAFAKATQAALGSANDRTDLIAQVAAQQEGLHDMGSREQIAGALFNQRNQDTNERIRHALQVYQMGQALRNKAMMSAQGQSQLELQNAQNAGSGAMLMGGLFQGAGQLGAYGAGQQAAGTGGGMGDAGYTDLMGPNRQTYNPNYLQA